MNYSLYIAQRLLKQKRGKLSGPVVKVATAAVALGVAVMIISLCVGFGFKREVRDKIVGFGTHVQIVSFDYNHSYETNPLPNDSVLCAAIKKIDGVKNLQTFILKPGIIKTDDAIQGVALKGVDETFDWTFIDSVMEEGASLASDTTSGSTGIVLSRSLSSLLKLGIGDPVRMYFIQNNNIRARKFVLQGVFNSHFPEFDEKMAFVNSRHLAKLNNWSEGQISGYEVMLDDFDKMDDVVNDIAAMTSSYVGPKDTFLRVQSIKELQPQMFGWLNLLDMNIAVILVLIIAVAGLNMISGLLILILENTNTIGLLKAMGSRNSNVRRVFLYMAMWIIGRGMLIGNVLGIGVCLVQKYTGLVSLDPDSYYLDTVPILLSPVVLLLMNVGTLALTTLMLVGPSYVVSRIVPAKAIRFN
ncbi:MAG: ABC transporter permease [Bacteroidales bacterium]|nr:ABC transporter permease [Bacteroidales bacterium]